MNPFPLGEPNGRFKQWLVRRLLLPLWGEEFAGVTIRRQLWSRLSLGRTEGTGNIAV